jgi:hypothetical protein
MGDVARKLLIKAGHRVGLVNAPDGYLERLQPLPDGADVVKSTSTAVDVLQVFVRDAADLRKLGPRVFQRVKPDGFLWVCYPKGGTRAGTDLNRDVLWKAMEKNALVGVTLVAIDDTWSAMRFRPPDRVGR